MQSIIKKDQVRAALPGTSPAPCASEPRERSLRVLSESGLVHAIEITCSCGEITLVELDQSPATESSR